MSSKRARKALAQPFLSDVKTLRERARQHIADGIVTRSYTGETRTATQVLNTALATELVCVLRYRRHYLMARGIHPGPDAAEFLQYAGKEQEQADRIAQRIVQLGGEPDFAPGGLASRSHSQHSEGENLLDMIKEDLVAERIAIDSYREMITYFSAFDPTTRKMLEEITATEEEHADDLADLLHNLPGDLRN